MGTGISLCMIVLNEAANLARAVDSLKPIVDEIIIVDTGSNDNTPKIAEELGALVIRQPWENDFAKARNTSIESASGDWIIVIDADEFISEKDHERILQRVKNKNYWGYQFVSRTYTRELAVHPSWLPNPGDYPETAQYAGFIENTNCRLFQNHMGIHYVGQVHELVEPAILSLGGKFVPTPIPIHHLGRIVSSEDRIKDKGDLYLRLAREKIAAEPGQFNPLYQYGEACLQKGDYGEAARAFRETLQIAPGLPICLLKLAISYDLLGSSDEAIDLYREVLDKEPDNYTALINAGDVLEKRDEQIKAKKLYERAIKAEPDQPVAYVKLADLFINQNNHAETVQLLEKAKQITPNNAQLRTRLGIAHLKLNNISKTLDNFGRAYTLSPIVVDATLKRNESVVRELISQATPFISQECREPNRQLLIKKHPETLFYLTLFHDRPRPEIERAKDGSPIPVAVDKDGKSLPLASRYNPVKEGRVWAESVLNDWAGEPIVVFGFGFGYHIEPLLAEFRAESIFIVEAEPAVLKSALACRDLASILAHDKLTLIVEPSCQSAAIRLKRALDGSKSKIFKYGPSVRLFPVYSGVVEQYLSDFPERQVV